MTMSIELKPLRRPRDWRHPWRWRPHDGEPRCLLEQLTQYLWRNALLVYIAAMGTLAVLLQLYWRP